YPLGPGRYYVTAVENYRRRDDGPPLQAPSNTIEITVVKARKDSTAGLRLLTGTRPVFDRPEEVDEDMRLTNTGDRDIEISSDGGQPWFHDVTLDFKTLSGEPVPRKHDTSGREAPFEKEVWGLYSHRQAGPGPFRPGDHLDGGILLYKVYDLTPGAAYTLAAHVTLQTSDGPVELVSNTVTFVIRAK
ncbi:MAG TPA: hypothetical protein VLZ81_06335, partial [Blastocatellia bacterium]|nr:hypothetical protein [Blastocatellia bacterium]